MIRSTQKIFGSNNTSSFWNKLKKKPFFSLAPMAEVSDTSLRYMIASIAKPDVTYNEFVSADGISVGNRDKLVQTLCYSEPERPLVAQFFGCKPDNFRVSAAVARELGYDGVDINMGCPSRKVVSPKQASGAALINSPDLAKEIIAATQEGAGHLPVSVKTRIGFDEIEIDRWLPNILEMKPACLTLHLRTKKELSLVPAHWEHEVLDRVLEMRDQISPDTLIVGNGDVESIQDGLLKHQEFGVDGIMVGRAVYGNPWFFDPMFVPEYIPGPLDPTPMQLLLLDQKECAANGGPPVSFKEISVEERFRVFLQHAIINEQIYTYHYKPMIKMNIHFSAYFSPLANLQHTASLKKALAACTTSDEVAIVVNNFLISRNRQPLDYDQIKRDTLYQASPLFLKSCPDLHNIKPASNSPLTTTMHI
ncbi:hypothetical protein CYY_004949 [Polysphondylium violaceum]|uniref:DUS-like FMN-binding domain-containing protein n=1 Tax=Polysphondylium violaceum TaxID=133409 RepID=A0A8J4PUA8_9MYCE|nr:hypothetical protein CYY_004949 [Polysphondylium violaceum]